MKPTEKKALRPLAVPCFPHGGYETQSRSSRVESMPRYK